jgi:hypothetical protein
VKESPSFGCRRDAGVGLDWLLVLVTVGLAALIAYLRRR